MWENSQLNKDESNSRKIILESSPKAIFIQAAGPCNSHCVFCSRGSDYEIFNLDVHKKRFEKSLYPFISKAESLILTGSGEFLLLPDAEKILEHFDTCFPHVNKIFSTNGFPLTPQIAEKIVYSKNRYAIHISLHASNAQLHKVLTRTDHFRKILGQLEYLLDLRRNTGSPTIHLIFVATTLNIEDFPNFIRLASRLKVDKVICYYNYIYVPAQKYLSCFFKQELTNKVLVEAEKLTRQLGIEVEMPPRFGLEKYPNPGICSEPWGQLMINSQGHILPCDVSGDCSERLDGNNFMEIWNGPYYQNLRKALIKGDYGCFKHCFRANPAAVNDFSSHVIHRGRKESEIDILWGDNF